MIDEINLSQRVSNKTKTHHKLLSNNSSHNNNEFNNLFKSSTGNKTINNNKTKKTEVNDISSYTLIDGIEPYFCI